MVIVAMARTTAAQATATREIAPLTTAARQLTANAGPTLPAIRRARGRNSVTAVRQVAIAAARRTTAVRPTVTRAPA